MFLQNILWPLPHFMNLQGGPGGSRMNGDWEGIPFAYYVRAGVFRIILV